VSVSTQLLEPLSLFQGLAPNELALLTHHVTIHQLTMGQDLFKEGEVARSCLVLVDGRVSVYLNQDGKEERIATLEPGAPIGHMALIDRKRRSATCKVTSPEATVLSLEHEHFDQLFSAQTPLAYKILDNLVMDLVGRLRQTNERLLEATRERNEARIKRKTRGTTATLTDQADGDAGNFDIDEMDVDSIEVYVPSLEQRMRERRDK